MAEKTKLITNDPNLEAALEKVRRNQSEMTRFAADPDLYLKSAGVDTSQLTFGKGHAELSDADLAQVSGGTTVCDSVGVGEGLQVCHSVGN